MRDEVSVEYVVVSCREEAPPEALLAQALASAGLGVAEFRPAAGSTTPGRRKLGSFQLPTAGAAVQLRVSLALHDEAVTADMGERPFAALTRTLSEADVETLQRGRLAATVRLTGTAPLSPSALARSLRAVATVAGVLVGVTIDPAAQRCWPNAELVATTSDDPTMSVTIHVTLHDELWDADSRWLHTHGLQKFGQPELDLVAVPHSLLGEGHALLALVIESLARGALLVSGQEIVLDQLGAAVALSAVPDVGHQAPFGRLRLADRAQPGARQGSHARRLLMRMALAEATAAHGQGDDAKALAALDRVVGADPDDCDALSLKAQIYLAHGRAHDALDLAEFMTLRVPGDYRGPLTRGLALTALGRHREALDALDRAIAREPESAESFAVRADVHDCLGHEHLAARDRARASYLQA